MSDFFGGDGKNSVDNYYAFTQTSGGGSSGGNKGCGSSATIFIIIIVALVAIQNFVAALIAFGSIALLIFFIYQMVKHFKKRV